MGNRADLILVEDDPLINLSNLQLRIGMMGSWTLVFENVFTKKLFDILKSYGN